MRIPQLGLIAIPSMNFLFIFNDSTRQNHVLHNPGELVGNQTQNVEFTAHPKPTLYPLGSA